MPDSHSPTRLRVEKPWGHEIIWTPAGLERTGKLLSIKAGRRLSLQYHESKEETLCLISGHAILWLENDAGEIQKLPMAPETGYTVRPMKKHRLEAVTDTLVAEVSEPEKGNTVRIEDDYARGTETPDMRLKERAANLN